MAWKKQAKLLIAQLLMKEGSQSKTNHASTHPKTLQEFS
jgi:hypothetical protein